ncbi:hypothetical protein ScalyP_jg1787 [Parmales sp. scaly parma]|nr:hypothetical protein ScalyP_jg1787 [Parmales sp. scaly parma]
MKFDLDKIADYAGADTELERTHPEEILPDGVVLEDYTNLTKKASDIMSLIRDKKDEKLAASELKERAALLYYEHHPDLAFEQGLPAGFVTYFPHVATKVEILEHNKKYTYYLAREVYDHGHGGAVHHCEKGLKNSPFVLVTLRSATQLNKVMKCFCIAHSRLLCPGYAEAALGVEWEVRGEGDSTKQEVSVDAEGEVVVVDVVVKGEKKTKTGRLKVTIPGDHECFFYDRSLVSDFVRRQKPLFLN